MKTIIAGKLQYRENWKVSRIDRATGEIIDTEEFCNDIVNDGLSRQSIRLNSDSETYFKALAVGTGTTAVAVTDTELETEVTRELATLSNGTYTAIFSKTFTFGGDYTITEAGIFDSATVSGSTMLSHVQLTPKNVSTSISLMLTATITVGRVV